MTPTTLPEALSLFDSPTPLDPLYALGYEPGAQQRALILRTLQAIERPGPANILFPGAAGTGKTTAQKLLLSVLDDCRVSFAVGAPTHKAAGRAAQSLDGRWAVTTHHRWWCGSVNELVEEGEEFSDNLALGVAIDRVMHERVLVIDESSMISEADLAAIRTVAPNAIIIAVGDHHQLPPVGGAYGFDWTDADTYGLTEVFRQAEGSPVLLAATKIREQRVPFTWSKCADWKAGAAILREAGVATQWLDASEAGRLLAKAIKETDGNAAAVVGTHVSRVLVNDAARACLGLPSRRQGPARGERLVARATAGGLANATACTVLDSKRQDFGPRFGMGWVLRVRTEENRERSVALLEQQWLMVDSPANRGKIPYSVRQMLQAYCDEDTAFYGDDIAALVLPKADAWSEAHEGADAPKWLVKLWKAEAAGTVGAWGLYLAKHLAALDTGYAVTCHAAQGSQWSKVMVVADWVDFLAQDPVSKEVDPDAVYRWSYTALTRASESALVVNKSKGGWVKPPQDRDVSIGSASRDWQARRMGR